MSQSYEQQNGCSAITVRKLFHLKRHKHSITSAKHSSGIAKPFWSDCSNVPPSTSIKGQG